VPINLAVSDPILFRGLERLLIVVCATIIAYLGYRLYRTGPSGRPDHEGPTGVDFGSNFVRFAVSGTGPGLAFMALGMAVIIVALFTGGASYVRDRTNFEPETEGSRDKAIDMSIGTELPGPEFWVRLGAREALREAANARKTRGSSKVDELAMVKSLESKCSSRPLKDRREQPHPITPTPHESGLTLSIREELANWGADSALDEYLAIFEPPSPGFRLRLGAREAQHEAADALETRGSSKVVEFGILRFGVLPYSRHLPKDQRGQTDQIEVMLHCMGMCYPKGDRVELGSWGADTTLEGLFAEFKDTKPANTPQWRVRDTTMETLRIQLTF
jgi:hypothetical protein